jgi:hypothetical protein
MEIVHKCSCPRQGATGQKTLPLGVDESRILASDNGLPDLGLDELGRRFPWICIRRRT